MEFNFEQGGYEILNICDANIRVDTTKFATINYDNIFNKIRNYL